MPQNYRRKKKLIKPSLQLKAVAVFGLTAVAVLVVHAIQTLDMLSEIAAELPNDREIVMAGISGHVVDNLLVGVALLAPILITAGILATFRIAGPVHRFEVFLSQVIAGEKPSDCYLRDGDELRHLCMLINQATAPLRRVDQEDEKLSPAEAPEVDPPSLLLSDDLAEGGRRALPAGEPASSQG